MAYIFVNYDVRKLAPIKQALKRKVRMKSILYTCDNCETKTSFTIIQTHEVPDDAPPTEYTFATCDVCSHPSVFYRENLNTLNGYEDDIYYRMWPQHERHIGFQLPKIVRTSYEEVVKCEEVKAWIAAAVMVGRTLEAVCKDFDPSTKTISNGLTKLHSSGKISDEILDWSNHLRFIRNSGVHATQDTITREDAVEVIDFLQVILEILYDLRPKFDKMKARHSKP